MAGLENRAKHIAVIGAGASGLCAIKCCKEENLDVTCFEKTNGFGGLWRYRDNQDVDGIPSVMKTTVINTSKELSAFSDFPPPKEFPVFLHHAMMLKYFDMYAEKFDLHKHIQYNSEVTSAHLSDDYSDTGRWLVTIKNNINGTEITCTFDGVMVCSGHHAWPYSPTFPGQDKYNGIVMHSHSLKTNLSFIDKTVVVVGVGNSGLDAAAELSNTAKQVYLSTRRGVWMAGKTYDRGIPSDGIFFTRLYDVIQKLSGRKLSNMYGARMFNKRFDHDFLGIKPKHGPLEQHPSVNEFLPLKILSGSVVVKKNIKYFTERGVIFDGEMSETVVDAVVLATGYTICFPFLSSDIIKVSSNSVELYKYTFPPNLKHPSLAFIGLVQPFGSIFPVSENQSRWYALLMNGKMKLPKKEFMNDHIQMTKAKQDKRYVKSLRHTVQVDLTDFMDQIAEEYGVKPNLSKYFFTDHVLFWACFMNPCVAYQYRLNGPHSWDGARNAVLGYNYRMSYPTSTLTNEAFKYRMYYPYMTLITEVLLIILVLLVIFMFLICYNLM